MGRIERRGFVGTHPRCFLQEWQTQRLRLTRRVGVANAGLKVIVSSVSCRLPVRAAEKGLGTGKWKVESSKLKEEKAGEAMQLERT